VDQGQQLAAWPVRARPLTQIDHLIGGLLDAKPLGQRGGQQQPGVGDRLAIIEGDDEAIGLWEDAIEKVPS
jgi:hypothetical protein